MVSYRNVHGIVQSLIQKGAFIPARATALTPEKTNNDIQNVSIFLHKKVRRDGVRCSVSHQLRSMGGLGFGGGGGGEGGGGGHGGGGPGNENRVQAPTVNI